MDFLPNSPVILSRFRHGLIIALASLLWFSTLHADTTWVAGEVWGVWGRRGNPYMVTDTLTIPHDSTLQIMPGVEIYFQDQEIRRTPILVHGRLRAVGEEQDSIYFLSPVTAFTGIWDGAIAATEVRLEYCVLDSALVPVMTHGGITVVKHSYIRGSPESIQCSGSADTIIYCDLVYANGGAPLAYMTSPAGVFQHNRGTVGFFALGSNMAPIFDNQVNSITLYGGSPTEVFDNDIDGGTDWMNSSHWYDNHMSGLIIIQSSPLVENNTMESIFANTSLSIIRVNEIYGHVSFYESSVLFERNLLIASTILNQAILLDEGDNNRILRNTIIFGDRGISISSSGIHNQVVNNIFMGDGVNCTGIYCSTPVDFTISYNDIYQVNEVTYNCELDTGNIIIDPRLCGGYPYDYHLQANSPCIDAGDPSSPLDPDGTRADMGCYYFDQLIDQPPAIISPVTVNVQRGQILRYEARATDDHGPLRFGFWAVPGWLHRVHQAMDFEEGIAVLSGRVPSQQEDFTFGVWVEDGASQRDSQEVSVRISSYTILAGEVTGVLTREQSPYMVVEDVVVPAGDSLRIEPGVEIRFQWETEEDLRHRILVRGNLNAIGTSEDTIRFLPEFGDSLLNAWRGIWCVGPSQDTSRFSYTSFLNGYYAVAVDSQNAVTVRHTRIVDTRYGVHVSNASWAEVDSCLYVVYNPDFNTFAYVYSGTAVITNTNSELLVPFDYATNFDVNDSALVTIHGCTFVGSWGGRADHGSRLEFIGNRVKGNSDGVGYGNSASGIVANNIFSNGDGISIYSGDSVLISNNFFYQTDVGINFSNHADEVSIRNNVFLANEVAIEMYNNYPPLTSFSYNDFFNNDSDFVNCIPDSTNIFLDPMVQDTINFRLSLGSPCIDAGDPDPFFNDVDSTRNDIGCWGGPWGESYPYPTLFVIQSKPLPTDFALLPPYPNPFNSILVIPFTLPIEREVIINIYNILGQKVQEFSFPPLSPGVHRILWNPTACASGIYIIQFTSNGREFIKKALLLK